jgi:hypothetical protein
VEDHGRHALNSCPKMRRERPEARETALEPSVLARQGPDDVAPANRRRAAGSPSSRASSRMGPNMSMSFMLKPVDQGGWVGSWAPGIGDPTIAGWLTTALYFLTSAALFYVIRTKLPDGSRGEAFAWRAMFVCVFALGVNKQLDLQSAFTEAGRILAHRQGWYGQRRLVQFLFIMGLGVTTAAACALLVKFGRGMPAPTRLALLGIAVLSAFVVIRAASFHHVDWFLGSRFWGVKANWVLEDCGVLLVLTAGLWRVPWRRN